MIMQAIKLIDKLKEENDTLKKERDKMKDENAVLKKEKEEIFKKAQELEQLLNDKKDS